MQSALQFCTDHVFCSGHGIQDSKRAIAWVCERTLPKHMQTADAYACINTHTKICINVYTYTFTGT